MGSILNHVLFEHDFNLLKLNNKLFSPPSDHFLIISNYPLTGSFSRDYYVGPWTHEMVPDDFILIKNAFITLIVPLFISFMTHFKKKYRWQQLGHVSSKVLKEKRFIFLSILSVNDFHTDATYV